MPDHPVTTIAGVGRVGSRPKEDLTFTAFAIHRSDIDLRTVRRLAPAVILGGRLAATGTLDGPLHNATFRGVAEHRDGALPVSRAEGMVRLDTRADTLRMATDLVFDRLAFDGIRPAFPSLKARGGLSGSFVSEGTLSRLEVQASLTGELGTVEANGFITVSPPKWGAEQLLLRFSRLDLAALTGRDRMPTNLNGELRATGVIDTLRAPDGDVQLALSRSLARDVALDTAFAIVSVHDSILKIDTSVVAMRGGRASGSGTLGWAAPYDGRMLFNVASDNLAPFDTLLLAALDQQRDTAPDALPLGGKLRSTIQVTGSLDSLLAAGDILLEQLAWQQYRAPRTTATFAWANGTRPTLSAGLSSDSVVAGGLAFRNVSAQLRGWTDSLGWSAGTTFGPGSRADAAGTWWRTGTTQVLAFDTLLARLPLHTYRLREMAALTIGDSAPFLSPVTLAATDGAGLIRVGGRLPGKAPGSLAVNVFALNLRDLYGALQRDTAGIDGNLGFDLRIGGTAASPTVRGAGQLEAARLGDFQAPFIQSKFDYADRRLNAALQLWRTGERVLDVDAQLPVDLAFSGAKQRRLAGPLAVRARGDSVDLGILEAVTPAVRDVRGRLSGDVTIGGTWDAPRLDGNVVVRGGAMRLPGLGVHFTGIEGRAQLQGDSAVLRDVKIESGGGTLRAGGSVRLKHLIEQPILALDFQADRFLAMNVRNFGTLTGTTRRLRLQGPAVRRHVDRRPGGEQRRHLLRRSREQAGHRPGSQSQGPDARRSDRYDGDQTRQHPGWFSEPVPRFAPDEQFASAARFPMSVPLRSKRANVSSTEPCASTKPGAIQSVGHGKGAARQLYLENRTL